MPNEKKKAFISKKNKSNSSNYHKKSNKDKDVDASKGSKTFSKKNRKNTKRTTDNKDTPKTYTKTHKRVKRKRHVIEEKPKMPLNKFLAHAGLGTRRETVDIIKKGDIKVNGVVETSPSYQVQDTDQILFKDDEVQNTKDRIYLLINKSSGVTSALHTSDKNKNLSLYTEGINHQNLNPIGKLRKTTSGLILLSSDGDLANTLNDKNVSVENVYRLHTDTPLSQEHKELLLSGVKLLGNTTKIDEIHQLDEEDPTQIGVRTSFEGDDKIYKLFKDLGYTINKLDRVIYAGLTKKNLPRGTSRLLNAKEIVKLKHFNSYSS